MDSIMDEPIGSREAGYRCGDCGWPVERREIIVFKDEEGQCLQICQTCLHKIASIINIHANLEMFEGGAC